MSTLPGQASKGEKTKQKFQSLDINSLYRVSRGENLEKTQQKSSLTYIKHGMQSLGKVPNARRAPANLPSLKAEHSGSDAAVPLVPAGSPGWGKQDQPPTGGSQPPQGSLAPAPPQQQQQQQQQQQSHTGPGGHQPQQQQNQLSSHQQAIALPISMPAPPHAHKQLGTAGSANASSGGGDKLWSSVMGGHPEGSGGGHPPLYQSVQFQHEFPSLDGVPPARTPDGQPVYAGAAQPGGGGLSLRPQTEGSWTQGGQRGGSQHGVAGVGVGVGVENGPAVGGPRGAQGPLSMGGSGGPPQLPAQVGMRGGPGNVMAGAAPPPPVEQPFPPQIRGVMPPFMCKGSNFQQGPVGPTGMGSQQQQHMQSHMMQPPSSQQQRMNGGRHQPPRMANADRGEQDDAPALLSRPIIKEEELSRMDEIGRDMGWAESGEIDYNQKLAFSDDETDSSKPMAKRESLRRQQSLTPKDQQQHHQQPQQQQPHHQQQQHQQPHHQQQQHQQPQHQQMQEQSQGPGASPSDRNSQWPRSRGGRSSVAEEEELRAQQRRTQTEREVELAVQRAKQRKEEEEKRFQEERKQGAAKKLMELEEKIQKRASDSQEKSGSLPPVQMEHVDIPLPDFQKEKERDKDRDTRAKTPSDTGDDKNNQGGSFRHMAQIDGKGGFPRKHQKGPDRERDQNVYPRPFQYDLPPRFKNQRNSSSSNLQPNAPYHQWSGGQNAPKGAAQGMQNRNSRLDSPEIENKESYGDDRREYKRQSSEDSYRSSHSHHSQQDLQKIPESKRYPDESQEPEPAFKSQYTRKEEEKWHKDKDTKDDWGNRRSDKREEKYERERERPHRPDSRDSRSTRHSRDSDSRNEYSWADSVYEPAYEEKKKDDRRPAVPGPITKERIEAEDQRGNEKRTLTQLKKGGNPEKVEKDDDAGSWADIIEHEEAKAAAKKLPHEQHKGDHRLQQSDQAQKKSEDYSSSRNRSYSQKKNWNSGPSDYPPRSQLWSKRSGSRHKGGKDYHPGTTDSDASAEEHVMMDQKNDAKNEAHKGQRSPKPIKKLDKEDKNKENKQDKMMGEHKKQDKPEKKDNYIPRGEPSRHGRGGGAFRSGGGAGGRMGGLGKRIDGYGPPPSKSPFSSHPHEENKEKKTAKEDIGTQQTSTSDHSAHQQHASSTTTSTSTTATTTTSSEDKIKQSQQALAAGIIGKKAAAEFVAKDDEKPAPAVTKSGSGGSSGRNDRGGRQDMKRGGLKGAKGRDSDAIPEGFDDRNRDKLQNKPQGPRSSHSRSRNEGSRNNQPSRIGGNEKRSYDRNRQNSSSSLRKDEKLSDHNATSDVPLKDSEHEEKEEKTSVNGDSEGFQEVKSKKNLKERQKSMDEKPSKNGQNKDIKDKDVGKDKERERRNKNLSQLSSQQHQQLIHNIPPLMGTPVNPPAGMTPLLSQQPPPPPLSKNQFDSRPRQAKLAPRFAKQKLQKAQMQQQHGGGGVLSQAAVSDIAVDINKGLNVYGMKDSTASQVSVSACAWDKPLGSQLRNLEHDNVIGVSIDNIKGLEAGQPSPQGTSPNSEKLQDKPLLDGANPPVNTIIFENTNFKQAPGARSSRNDKPRAGPVPANAGSVAKLEDSANTGGSVIDGASMMAGFNKPGAINELLQNKDTQSDGGIQLPLFKEDSADMKLDFFGSDLQFSSADDKGKTLCMAKSIHAIGSGNNTVDSLDIKIASVKKVWETSEQESEEMSFGGPPLDSNVFNQGKDTSDEAHHHHDVYTSSPNQTVNTSTNVCKVKPTQQVSGGSGTGGTGASQTVLGVTSGAHSQQHSGGGAMVAPGLMGNPLSPPPPMPQVLGAAAAAAAAAGVGLGPQQYTTNQHIGYQASLSGSTQYGIPAIPSPPTVPLVYGQTTQQQLQAAAAAAHQTAAAGLYGAFQIDQIGQGRSQFSQYPSAYHAHGGLGQTASSPYTTQSVYLQAGPPHAPPPPTAATAQAPPPDLYSNYRLSAAFGQGGQLSNPSTMMISSTTNSLMSVSSVKPAGGQTISAIGTKAGGVGQAFQPSPAQQSAAASQQSQQQQQQQQVAYAMYDPSIAAAAANYLAAGGPGAAMRGGPPSGNPSAAAVQNSVAAAAAAAAVQGLQQSSSFYSAGSTSQTGYFQQPGNSSMQSTQQMPQHQAGYGLQGNVFGSHGQSHTGTGLQSYNSHFLTAPMQVAAALNAQQFRSGLPAAAAAAAYMKGVAGQQMGDQATRAQQLKSPGSQEVLSSVFNTGPQIPSPKSRQNCKQPPPQSSPTAQQKYNLYQGVGNQQNPNIQRYPTPIQRPVNYQQMQQNNSVNQKHRSNPSYKVPNRQYYGGQISHDKSEDSKMNDSSTLNNTSNSSITKSAMSAASGTTEKDKIKEETTALKD